MKWHVICLTVILLLSVNPTRVASRLATDHDPFTTTGLNTNRASYMITTPISHHGVSEWLAWFHWQAVVLAYGAWHFGRAQDGPGRVTLCRWKLSWRRVRLRWKRRRTRQGDRAPSGSRSDEPRSASGDTASQTPAEAERSDEARSTAGDDGPVSLRLVVRPGVILTKRGLQLRPMIARLGNDVTEYRALWEDKEPFKVTIRPLLQRACPLCEGQRGFRCIGSDERSVIPLGSRTRAWFRIQKVQCRLCEAITRILPTFCLPFKSHHAQTIQNALENCWRRNTSYRDTTAVLNQSLPEKEGYEGHSLPYDWTLWLGGLAIHLPQFLVWLGLQLPRHGLLDEVFMAQDKGTDNRRIFGVTVQDPESTVIWNIVRTDRNDTSAFKRTLQHLKEVDIHLRAITTDGWPAILRAVREELEDCIHLLCYFHAKQNIFETVEKYRRAKKLPADAPEVLAWQQAFFEVLEAPNAKLYRARLRALTKRAADEPLLLARCESLSRKIHHNTYRLRSPLLTATTSRVELTFKFLTRKMESLYSFRRSKCDAAQKSLTVWATVRNFIPYLPGAKYAGQSPAQLAGVDLQGLPWLQYINLKLSEVA